MAYDLNNMSRDELQKLSRDVERSLATVDQRRRADARAAAEKAVREHGFSLQDVLGKKKEGGSKKNPPKYRNPDEPTQTWSGRGRQPAWIKDALENGKSLDDFAI